MIIKIPLRAEIPNTVRNPTREPREIMPSPKNAASIPPTRADGKSKNDRVAKRVLLKEVCRRRKIAIKAIKPRTI